MTESELIAVLVEALEVEASSIEREKAIAEYPEWNSLAWLTIMSLLDERYGIGLSGAEVRSFRTVQDFVENVTGRAAAV